MSQLPSQFMVNVCLDPTVWKPSLRRPIKKLFRARTFRRRTFRYGTDRRGIFCRKGTSPWGHFVVRTFRRLIFTVGRFYVKQFVAVIFCAFARLISPTDSWKIYRFFFAVCSLVRNKSWQLNFLTNVSLEYVHRPTFLIFIYFLFIWVLESTYPETKINHVKHYYVSASFSQI